MNPQHTRLIEALDRIRANHGKPNLRLVRSETRDPMKWRKRYNAFLKSQCGMCKGRGEIKVYGDFGEYEQPEPCPRCQRVNPYARTIDEIPF